MRTSSGIAACLAAVQLWGCTTQPTETDTWQARPVVQLVLSASRSTQDAFVYWSQDPAEPIVAQPRPVEPGVVALQLDLPGGGLVALDAVADSPGVFRAAVSVRAGGAYALQGSVGGTSFQGTTVVPALPTIVSPGGDTVDLGSCFPCTLSVEWQAPGAAVLEVQVRRLTGSGSTLLGLSVLHASPATIAIPPNAIPGELLFIAHDRGSADFLFMDPPIGNLGPMTGLLGSQAMVRKVLR